MAGFRGCFGKKLGKWKKKNGLFKKLKKICLVGRLCVLDELVSAVPPVHWLAGAFWVTNWISQSKRIILHRLGPSQMVPSTPHIKLIGDDQGPITGPAAPLSKSNILFQLNHLSIVLSCTWIYSVLLNLFNVNIDDIVLIKKLLIHILYSLFY